MDISSLYTNIPQEEGIKIVCKAYEMFYKHNTTIPTYYLRGILGLIIDKNLFQFNGENFVQKIGIAMGTTMAVSFANIFMGEIEMKIIEQSDTKPKEWKCCIDDISPFGIETEKKPS